MKRTIKLVILFLIFLSYNLFSVELHFDTKEDGLLINISNLDYKISKKSISNDSSYVLIPNCIYAYPSVSSDYAIDEFNFPIALPDFNVDLSYSIQTFDTINNIVLFKNKKTIRTTQNDKFSLINKGYKRAVPVASLVFRPFDYDITKKRLIVAKSVIINIHFKKEIQLITDFNSKEMYNFSNYINQDHIPTLILNSYYNIKKADKLLKKADWYSQDKTYLKITTKKDRISIINAKDIIKVDPSFSNLGLDYLHLIWEGEEYPIYIKDNGNDILDETDYIYFLGKRASGDTTWFDFYTSDANFFLFIDSSYQGLRLKDLPEAVSPSNQILSVKINKHIEEEHIYMYGYFPELYENVDGELWVWKIISPLEDRHFLDTLLLVPSPISNDTLNISVRFKSNRFNTKQNPNHKLRYIFNSDTLSTKEFPAKTGDFLTYNFNSPELVAGANLLNIQSLGFFNNNNELIIPDEVGIDYIVLQGNVAPFADKGFADFYIESQPQNSSLKIAGFKNNNIIAIDPDNQFIKINNNNTQGTWVNLASKSSQPFLSVNINDSSTIKSGVLGALVGTCFSPDYNKIEFKYFEKIDNSLVNYLNSIPSASIIAISLISNENLSNEVKNSFVQLGSKKINAYQRGNSFVMLLMKNSQNQIYEVLTQNNSATISQFIEHPNGKYFQTQMNLNEQIPYHLITSDIDNIEICSVEKCESSNLLNKQNQADVLVVYHKQFKEAAEKYVAFRKQTHKEFNFILIDIENVYKEFNYGKKSPHSLKNFLKYSANYWQKPAPSFIILFGDACWDTRKIMPSTQNTDYISSYGVPVSELWFCLLDEKDFIADIELGRVPARTPEQAMDYVDKIIDYELAPLEPWKKNILYLTGGYNLSENNQFYSAVEYYGSTIYDSKMCVDTFIIRKRNYSPVSSFEKDEIIARINQGMAWITYLGHGSPQFFDMDGWQAEYLDNKNKYSIFNSLSCNTGAFAEPQGTCRNEDYLLAKNKGFVSTAASTGVSFVDIDIEFHLRVSRQLAKVQNRMPTVIELYNNAKAEMLRNEPEILTAMTYSMLGDPLIALHINPQPDFYFLQQEIDIKNQKGESIISEDDSIATISGTVFNAGYSKPGKIKLLIIREYLNRKDSAYIEYSRICPYAYFNFNLPVFKMPGIHKITIIADPDRTNGDFNYSNNTVERYIEVFVKSLLPLEPLPYWDKETKEPTFRVINPEQNPSSYGYEFEIVEENNYNIIAKSSNDDINIEEAYIEWKPNIELKNKENYIFIAKAINPIDSTKTPNLVIPFASSTNYSYNNTLWKMEGATQLSTFIGNGFEIKQNENEAYLGLKNNYYKYKIISANGNENTERFGEIKYRDTTHIVSENVGDVPVGFNFVIISGKEGYFKLKRNFYTWGKYEWWEDSTGINMIKFLRDSVDSNDYVLIATCDQSFRLFVYHKELKTSGSLDTLVAVLKEYGSSYADSLRWGCSFAMVGKRGAKPGTFPEIYDTLGAKITIEDSLLFYNQYAALTTPWIGPAKYWKNINIDADIPMDDINYKVSIFGRDQFNANENLLFEIDTSLNIQIHNIPPNNAYLKYKLEIFRNNDTLEPKIYALKTDFAPTEEFALLKSLSYPDKDTILRGEVAYLNFGIQNISARASSDSSMLKIRAYSNSGDIFTKDLLIEPLLNSHKRIVSFSTPTDNFSQATNISAKINSNNNNNELYYFNNICNYIFHIYEDTIKPEIILILDDKKVQNGDYSSLVPKVEIQLLDNSPRPVDSSKILVRVNGYVQPQPKVKDYLFQSFGREVPLKAKLTFTPDTLDYRDNVFIIKGTDASGNENEIMVYVFVSPKGFIEKAINSPNPFTDKTTFKIKFVSPIQEASASIYIFNEVGQRVRTIDKQIIIGENEFEWDAKDDFGNVLPSGMYIYVVLVQSQVFVEPVKGNCLYIK